MQDMLSCDLNYLAFQHCFVACWHNSFCIKKGKGCHYRFIYLFIYKQSPCVIFYMFVENGIKHIVKRFADWKKLIIDNENTEEDHSNLLIKYIVYMYNIKIKTFCVHKLLFQTIWNNDKTINFLKSTNVSQFEKEAVPLCEVTWPVRKQSGKGPSHTSSMPSFLVTIFAFGCRTGSAFDNCIW